MTGGGQPTALHWANPPLGQPYPAASVANSRYNYRPRQSGRATLRGCKPVCPSEQATQWPFCHPPPRQGGNRGRGFRQHRHPSLTHPYMPLPSTYHHPALLPITDPVIPPAIFSCHSERSRGISTPTLLPHRHRQTIPRRLPRPRCHRRHRHHHPPQPRIRRNRRRTGQPP